MRLMSFAYTPTQLLDGTKTVTRRVGWENLKPGDRLKAVRKAMGLKRGESPEVLAEIAVVSVRRERLDFITRDDCIAEGFPDMKPREFVAMFCSHMSIVHPDERVWKDQRRKVKHDDHVTRIEFRVVPGTAARSPTAPAPAVQPMLPMFAHGPRDP